jgi:tRNA pseudouridine38-40 synthase
VADKEVKIVCAGRTDTGVHAIEQVVHFDTNVPRELHAWVLGTNTNLPPDVSVLWAVEVEEDFHARFSATARSYRYVILSRQSRSALNNARVSWVHYSLDEKRMVEAAGHFIGKHDFTSFRAVACQSNTPVRKVEKLHISRHDEYIVIDITANAFLHHMVRNIAGVLLEIGRGDKEPEWVPELLEARDRTVSGITAPPGGLYLMSVKYPAQYGLPAHVVVNSVLP